MEKITSRANPLIGHVRRLAADRRYRRAAGELLCEGPKLLEEALRWGAALRTVVCADPARLPSGLPDGVLNVMGAPGAAPRSRRRPCRARS